MRVDEYDYVVISTAPSSVDSPVPQSALLVADIVLIPFAPPPPDLWAAMDIKALINNAQTVNETLRPYLVADVVQGPVSSAAPLATRSSEFCPGWGEPSRAENVGKT